MIWARLVYDPFDLASIILAMLLLLGLMVSLTIVCMWVSSLFRSWFILFSMVSIRLLPAWCGLFSFSDLKLLTVFQYLLYILLS